MLESILDLTSASLTVGQAVICAAVALVLGFLISASYLFRHRNATKSMAVSLVLLPLLVMTVIMMVNGNLGAGVAVLGAFSLVRFRSVPGSARDIISIFAAMAVGLACGMGYVVFAAIIAVIVCAVQILLAVMPFGEKANEDRELRIIIPESLDYMEAFDDIFTEYTSDCSLERVKTTNLGSMFDLRYRIRLKDNSTQKEMIDKIRCRNGNLTVALGHWRRDTEEL